MWYDEKRKKFLRTLDPTKYDLTDVQYDWYRVQVGLANQDGIYHRWANSYNPGPHPYTELKIKGDDRYIKVLTQPTANNISIFATHFKAFGIGAFMDHNKPKLKLFHNTYAKEVNFRRWHFDIGTTVKFMDNIPYVPQALTQALPTNVTCPHKKAKGKNHNFIRFMISDQREWHTCRYCQELYYKHSPEHPYEQIYYQTWQIINRVRERIITPEFSIHSPNAIIHFTERSTWPFYNPSYFILRNTDYGQLDDKKYEPIIIPENLVPSSEAIAQ